MAYAMDFNAVWPLLRKEKWTWKAATGIQIQYGFLVTRRNMRGSVSCSYLTSLNETSHNYVKSGRKVKGGRQGIDYFNGEDDTSGRTKSSAQGSTYPTFSCGRKDKRVHMQKYWARTYCDLTDWIETIMLCSMRTSGGRPCGWPNPPCTCSHSQPFRGAGKSIDNRILCESWYSCYTYQEDP